MNILANVVPFWVSIAFLLSIFIIIHFIAATFKRGALQVNYNRKSASQIYKVVILFYAAYFLYVSILSISGIFHFNSIPPPIFLFSSIPFLIFLLVVVLNLSVYKKILKNISLQSLVRLHVFRFLGAFLFLLYYYGSIPAEFAYIAGIADVVIAASCIFVAKAIENDKPYARVLTLIWNSLGLLDVFSVMSTAIIITRAAVVTGDSGLIEINSFPFCLIPAFAPATIFFLHISIFKKLFTRQNFDKLQPKVA